MRTSPVKLKQPFTKISNVYECLHTHLSKEIKNSYQPNPSHIPTLLKYRILIFVDWWSLYCEVETTVLTETPNMGMFQMILAWANWAISTVIIGQEIFKISRLSMKIEITHGIRVLFHSANILFSLNLFLQECL